MNSPWKNDWQEETEKQGTLLIERRAYERTSPPEGTYIWLDVNAREAVEVLDQSPDGIGVRLPEDTSFAFKGDVHIDYEGTRRIATVVHLTQIEDGFRLGLQWRD